MAEEACLTYRWIQEKEREGERERQRENSL
jgi:hypothetical protein